MSSKILVRARHRPADPQLTSPSMFARRSDENHALGDVDVDVSRSPFVEQDGELLLSPIRRARPSVAATLPAVSEASEFVSES